MQKVFMSELPNGLKLMADEHIEMAFQFEKKKRMEYIIFTNKRIVTNTGTLFTSGSFVILPYKSIARYMLDVVKFEIIVMPYADAHSEFFAGLTFRLNEVDFLEVEYVLANKICN